MRESSKFDTLIYLSYIVGGARLEDKPVAGCNMSNGTKFDAP